MTGRGWWCLVMVLLMLVIGVLRDITTLVVISLSILLWIGWEWVFFVLRVRTLLNKLTIEREIADDRAPARTLWQGREYVVRVLLHLTGKGRFPFLVAADPVPFGVQHLEGATRIDGELRGGEPLELVYRIHCPLPGVARFEGLRIEISDLQGFFSHVGFVRSVKTFPILPGVLIHQGSGPTTKRSNELMPPGIHRLRQPGSGSELLDLRDYIPGDPPRTIAWKVSARRDRLITKEFESEVPIRCTLFVDVSSSVRVPSPIWRSDRGGNDAAGPVYFRPLDRVVELAAGVIRANMTLRDLTGLCLFDEASSRMVRPDRRSNHQTRLLNLLGEAAALGPVADRADVERLIPVAYGLAQEIYPDLLREEINRVPVWMTWLVGFPRYTRHYRGWIQALHRSKRSLLLWGTTVIPLGLLAVNLVSALFFDLPDWARTTLGGILFFGTPLVVTCTWLLFLFSMLVSGKQRKLSRWRKKLAALFCVRGATREVSRPELASLTPLPMPGGLDALLENDDLFSLHLQAFLAEHQIPYPVSLYDERGQYLFALPEKVEVLSRALLHAVSLGRDNELYVLLVDLLELDHHLVPLLQSVRVAVGRHHQVMVLCPWPEEVPLPQEEEKGLSRPDRKSHLPDLVAGISVQRLHEAYQRIRQQFARLGVQVFCAASHEPVRLILDRMQRLRSARRILEEHRDEPVRQYP